MTCNPGFGMVWGSEWRVPGMVSDVARAGSQGLVACSDCDLLQHRMPLEHGQQARCPRCGALLYRHIEDVVNRTLALSLSALVLFAVANAFPFMEFKIAGLERTNYLVTGVMQLHEEGYSELAFIVAFTSILAPLAMISMLIYLTLPVRLGLRPPGTKQVLKFIEHIKPWSMMEVYMLGVIVAIIKLAQMADIELGLALWAFTALIVVLTAAIANFDEDVIWEAMEPSS